MANLYSGSVDLNKQSFMSTRCTRPWRQRSMFLMSKINLLTKDIYCLETQFAAAILAQTETSE